jgi:hypothetical protein
VGASALTTNSTIMAKVYESEFKIIEATPEEFLEIGLGGSNETTVSQIEEGTLAGFAQISIEGGGFIICDFCNTDVTLNGVPVYYVAVLNQILCKKCMESFISNQHPYEEDKAYENRNFESMKSMLESNRHGKV